MSMQILPPQQTLGSSLGQAIGGGLGKGLSAGIEQGRQAEALSQVRGMHPIDAAQALTRAGIPLQQSLAMLPQLQQFYRMQNYKPLFGGGGDATSGASMGDQAAAQMSGMETPSGEATPEMTALQQGTQAVGQQSRFGGAYETAPSRRFQLSGKELLPGETASIGRRAEQLLATGQAFDRDEARKLAEEEATSVQAGLTRGMKELETDLGTIFKDPNKFAGQAKQNLIDEMRYRVARGESPSKVRQELTKKARSIESAFDKSRLNYFSARETLNTLKSNAAKLRKEGLGYEFAKSLETKGFSPWYASEIAMPLDETNPDLAKNMKSIRRLDDKTMNKLFGEISPRDSVVSIATNLYKNGQDGRMFLEYVNEQIQKGNNLTTEQEDEIAEVLPRGVYSTVIDTIMGPRIDWRRNLEEVL